MLLPFPADSDRDCARWRLAPEGENAKISPVRPVVHARRRPTVPVAVGRNFAYVVSTRADGSPNVVPVWVASVGDRIAFFTQTTTSQYPNLERDLRVAISIGDDENPYRGANLRGRVVERRTDPPSGTR
jgi:hypothetical protein